MGSTGQPEASFRRPEVQRLVSLLVAVLTLGTLGFMLLEGWSLRESLYMTVITVTTVGFGEVRALTPPGEVFTMVLIFAGFTTFSYGAVVVGRALLINLPARQRKRMQKSIDALSGHVVLCGFGRLGQIVRRELEAAGQQFVVLDHDPEVIAALGEEGLLALQGDATHEEVLARAGVARASGVIAAVHSDADNVFITLTARGMNPEVPIVARAEDPRTESKLLQVGATQVVAPYALGGRRLAQAFLRPGAVDLADLAMGRSRGEMLIEEIPLPEHLAEDANTLAGLRLGSRFGLIAVGVRAREDGRLRFNPRAATPLHAGDRLLVLGGREGIDAFQAFLRERTEPGAAAAGSQAAGKNPD